jgi:hypothetical protein
MICRTAKARERKGIKRQLALLVVLLVVLSTPACGFSVGGVKEGLMTAEVCAYLAGDYAPVGPTDVFAPEDDFSISVEYSSLGQGQSIGVKWFQEDDLLYEQTVELDASNAGDGYAGFTLTNSALWSAGSYHADIYLDGEFDHTAEFRVE